MKVILRNDPQRRVSWFGEKPAGSRSRGMGQSGNNWKLKLDLPSEPSKSHRPSRVLRSPALNMAMVLLWALGMRKMPRVKLKGEAWGLDECRIQRPK